MKVVLSLFITPAMIWFITGLVVARLQISGYEITGYLIIILGALMAELSKRYFGLPDELEVIRNKFNS